MTEPYAGWDGEGDYVPPVEVGRRYRFESGGSLLEAEVVRTQGYAPNVVEVRNLVLDLDGWTITPLSPLCPFCEIAAGRTMTEVFWHGSDIMVFEPMNPVTPGHRLVVPVRHVADATVNPAVTAAVMDRAAVVAAATGGAANIITSIGPEATQTVFHLHVHVVPRRPGDGLLLPWSPTKDQP